MRASVQLLIPLSKLLGLLGWYLVLAVVLGLSPVIIFYGIAGFGEKTGWYRVEDYMCTIPQGCDEYIAERKRLREIRTAPK